MDVAMLLQRGPNADLIDVSLPRALKPEGPALSPAPYTLHLTQVNASYLISSLTHTLLWQKNIHLLMYRTPSPAGLLLFFYYSQA